MPDILKKLDVRDVAIISERIQFRQTRFDETFVMSVGVVLMNYGESYIKVACINGEFEGTKGDLLPRDGIPLCPNGHPLVETSTAPSLALIKEDI